ncbi:hypothetical protein Spla01_00135 [Streptomyces platensis]|uniref:Uncharacterized protein n=1 Tax=Streptomyces platensis TaxID=58346 RepID=A0ABX3Y6C8_STRPT|nr:hypothetical protein BG653_00190 [Streptomyces platensis]
MPEPNPNSCGRYSHWIPVCSTYKIPHSTSRSGNALRARVAEPALTLRQQRLQAAHSSSDTIQGDVPTPDRTLNSRPGHGNQDRPTSLCEPL